MKTCSLAALLFLCVLSANGQWFQPSAKFTVKVVDDDGNPVVGADVWLNFEQYRNSDSHLAAKGPTDDRGLFGAARRTSGFVTAWVTKAGYYDSMFWKEFIEEKGGRWQPWDQTYEVVLRRRLNPVPMYAKQLVKAIPVESEPFGFDLEAGDWTEPYGKGKTKDMVFYFSRKTEAHNNYEANLTLQFSNEGDGIQECPIPKLGTGGSELRMPRHAPEDGYQTNWSKFMKMDPLNAAVRTNVQPREDVGFFYRVRTGKGASGSVVGAKYGKISSDIYVETAGHTNIFKPSLCFTYYFNPDGTRNMEFDKERNLFNGVNIANP